jgi:predicted transporter
VPSSPPRVPPIPRASDSMLAMLISVAALVFILNFVAPFSESVSSAAALGWALALSAKVLLAALLIERGVEVARRRRWIVRGRSREERERGAFLLICVCGILVALAGVRPLQNLLAPDVVASLASGQRALLIWTDLVITTGLIAGVADGFHKLIHAARAAFVPRTAP